MMLTSCYFPASNSGSIAPECECPLFCVKWVEMKNSMENTANQITQRAPLDHLCRITTGSIRQCKDYNRTSMKVVFKSLAAQIIPCSHSPSSKARTRWGPMRGDNNTLLTLIGLWFQVFLSLVVETVVLLSANKWNWY